MSQKNVVQKKNQKEFSGKKKPFKQLSK
uniref:Ribosomal protein L32 n=1 Tax=Johnson-sea-linkia profunda TaxID=575876 RepID=A0A386AXU5_9CHLO|nr:ribosomal protein L32 [Johnson-sea-linkia profunda]